MSDKPPSAEERAEIGEHHFTGGGSCSWQCRVYCFFNLHRWSWPGGYCECCGEKDGFFDG
jgi:hypothetical protein